MKKMVIKNEDDVEKLYQKFKKRMIKHFRNGDSPETAMIKISKWMKKKTGFNNESINEYRKTFAEYLLVDESINQKEERDEDTNGNKETK